MASSASEALPPAARPHDESTDMVVHTSALAYEVVSVDNGSKRTEAERKRQREYQAAHLKKKKEEAEAAAHELVVLRNERALIAQSLLSALPDTDRPASMEKFNLVTLSQQVAGKLIMSRSAGPSSTGACALAMPQSSPRLPRAHSPAMPALLTAASTISCHASPRIRRRTTSGARPSAWRLAHDRACGSHRVAEEHP